MNFNIFSIKQKTILLTLRIFPEQIILVIVGTR